jgi:hypothetical protein
MVRMVMPPAHQLSYSRLGRRPCGETFGKGR